MSSTNKTMNCILSDSERRRYLAWLHSPSVPAAGEEETVIAFKIAMDLHLPPTKVFKALRGIDGVSEEMVDKVEAYISEITNLSFVQMPDYQRISILAD